MRQWRVWCITVLLFSSITAMGAAQAKQTVDIWSIGSETGTYGRVFQHFRPMLEERFPNLEINVSFVTGPEERFLAAIAGGIAPDVVTLSTRMSPAFIESGQLAPIDREVFGVTSDAELRNLFYGGSVGSIYISNDVYFMPTEVTTFGTYANLDLLSAVGIPSEIPGTWEEILANAKLVAQQNPDGSFLTQGMILNRGWLWPTFTWPSFVRQAGVDWLVNGEPQFTHPGVMRNLQFYQDLYLVEEVVGQTANNTAFFNGDAGYYFGASYELARMLDPDQVQFGWTSGAYPTFEGSPRVSTSYAWGMYVYSGSAVQREAWEIIEFLTNEENAPVWYQLSALLIPRAGDWIVGAVSDDPRRMPFLLELDYAQMEFAHTESQAIGSAIVDADNRIINDRENIRNVLEQLNDRISVIVGAD